MSAAHPADERCTQKAFLLLDDEVHAVPAAPAGLRLHPNELDRRRIQRALEARKRYRYVEPRVIDTVDGYCIESPCCSRNVDPDGGVVDIALLEFAHDRLSWRLYHRDHASQQWRLHSLYERLDELLEQLNSDPQRVFWQ